jgi:Uncharacterised protein family UPF0547
VAIVATCLCGKQLKARDDLAGKRVRCPACAGIVDVPAAAAVAEPVPGRTNPRATTSAPPRPRRDRYGDDLGPHDSPEAGDHRLTRFPVLGVILLNAATLMLFSSIRFNLMHGRMPKVRRDDPSAARGFWFLLIPVFNLYWFFFTYHRLVTRINEQRALRGLPPANLHWLVVVFGIGHILCALVVAAFFPPGIYVNPWSLIVGGVLFAAIQNSVNELVDLSERVPVLAGSDKTCPQCAEKVKSAARVCRFCGHPFGDADIDAAAEQASLEDTREGLVREVMLSNRAKLWSAWGWVLTVPGVLMGALLVPYVLGFGVTNEEIGLGGRLAGALFFTLPLLVPGVLFLARGRGLRRRLAEHREQTGDAEQQFHQGEQP